MGIFQGIEGRIETVVSSGSRVETVIAVTKKAGDLKQNRGWHCFKITTFGFSRELFHALDLRNLGGRRWATA